MPAARMAICFWLICSLPSLGFSQERDLEDPDPFVRRQAVDQLNIGAQVRESVRLLAKALKDPEEEIRSRAARALAEIGPSARWATDELAQALKDPSEEVRIRAAEAIGQIGPFAKSAVPALIVAVKDKSPAVRRRAVTALSLIGPPAKAAVPVLLEALDDKDEGARSESSVSQCAMRAIGYIGPDAREAVPKLLELAQNKESPHRNAAIATLGLFASGDERILPLLLSTLSNRADLDACRAAALGISQVGPAARKAVPDLIDLLKADLSGSKRSYDIRGTAMVALGAIGREARAAVPQLIEIAKQKIDGDDEFLSRHLREVAIHTLVKISPPEKELLNELVELLRTREKFAVTKAASDALVAFGADAVPPLVRAIAEAKPDGDSEQLRVEAIQILGRIGPRAKAAIPTLVAELDGPNSAQAAVSLAEIGAESIPALVNLVNETHKELRLASRDGERRAYQAAKAKFLTAIKAISQFGSAAKEVIPLLDRALEDNDSDIRREATTVLKRIGNAPR